MAAGERVCLVGRNGSGKSTLLKIAAGLIEPDRGERFMQPGATVRYLPQEPDLAGYATTLAYVEAGLGPTDDPHQARYLLQQLGLTGEEDPASLSGGEARRAALARVLAPAPDILLLDEPTNHLDLPAIEWLESELAAQRAALVLISHDRRFLENLSRDHGLARPRQDRRVEIGFREFEAWRDEQLAEEEVAQHKLDRKIVARGALGALRRHGAAQAQRAPHGASCRRCAQARRDVSPSRPARRRSRRARRSTSGKLVIEAKGIAKAFGERPIVARLLDAHHARRPHRHRRPERQRQDHAASTCSPARSRPTAATVRLGANLQMATLDQGRESLDPNWTLSEALTGGRGDTVTVGGQTQARHRLHEGLPVRAGAGAHAAARAVGRRARPADAGARAGQALQPAGARRADQRSRPRDARPAGGDARRLCRHRHPRSATTAISSTASCNSCWCRRARALGRICRRLHRHAGAARRRPRRHQDAAPKAASRARAGRAGAAALGQDAPSAGSASRSKHALETLPRQIAALQAERAPAAGAPGRPGPLRPRPPGLHAGQSRRSPPRRRSSPRPRSAGSSSRCCARRSKALDGVGGTCGAGITPQIDCASPERVHSSRSSRSTSVWLCGLHWAVESDRIRSRGARGSDEC